MYNKMLWFLMKSLKSVSSEKFNKNIKESLTFNKTK